MASSMWGSSYNNFLNNLQKSREEANAANEARLGEALGYYDQLINIFSPGGEYGKSLEPSLKLGFQRAKATSQQALTTSGLANTQMMAGAGQAYEENVANPARNQLEMDRFNKLAAAYQGKAGVLERVDDTGPTDEMIQPTDYGVNTGGAIREMNSRMDAFMDRARGTSSTFTPRANVGTIYGGSEKKQTPTFTWVGSGKGTSGSAYTKNTSSLKVY